jgi:hypothetical protein
VHKFTSGWFSKNPHNAKSRIKKLIFMIKRAILILGLIASSNLVSAKIIKIKTNGGWFGYRHVTELNPGQGQDIYITCNEPGFSRCRSASTTALTVPGGGTIYITQDMMDDIDASVMARINENNSNGTMLFGQELFIKYSYLIDTDNLTIEIYSLPEARQAGFNI